MKIQLNGYYAGNPKNVVLEVEEAIGIALVKSGGARLPDDDAPPVKKEEKPPEEEEPVLSEESSTTPNTPVEELDLTAAKKQVLFAAGLNTVADILAYCETNELTDLEGVGEQTAHDIQRSCAQCTT